MDTPTKEQLRKEFEDAFKTLVAISKMEKTTLSICDGIFNRFYSKYQSLLEENERLEELVSDKEILLEAAKNGCNQRDATIERQSKLLEKADEVINQSLAGTSRYSTLKTEYESMKSQQTQDNGK
jgi:hypothetical protein